MPRLFLLGTEGCHLCEEAQGVVADCLAKLPAKLEIESVDIAVHHEWEALYALRIPVLLETESRREIGWPFDHDQVTFFLQQL
jgi:hypothetical protein